MKPLILYGLVSLQLLSGVVQALLFLVILKHKAEWNSSGSFGSDRRKCVEI